ncbi:MAG: tRNA pseudouridine(13) synthase TruD [Neisseriaceae bacterium]
MSKVTYIPKLKTIPNDFLVSEVGLIDYTNVDSQQSTEYSHYKLLKSGFTTFEAINEISTFFSIVNFKVGFGGLKDEDGITEQNISIEAHIPHNYIENFNKIHMYGDDKFLKLTFIGYINVPIKIGEILGNNFKITVRGLDYDFAKYIFEEKKHAYTFINYYGTQRFGLPNAPKNTHELGHHLINNDYNKALSIIATQQNSVGNYAREAINNNKDSKLSLQELDPRKIAFYQSSYYSFKWNDEIKNHLKKSGVKCSAYTEEQILFLLPEEEAFEKSIPKFMPYTRVIYDGQKNQYQDLMRQSLVQLNLICSNLTEDEYHPGKYACTVNFFLPTGSYATVALTQVFNLLKSKI